MNLDATIIGGWGGKRSIPYVLQSTGCPKKKFKIEFFVVRQLWALSGHFWMLWTLFDIFGHSGHFLGILGTVGHFWALWALLGILGTVGHFLALLGIFGHSGNFWALWERWTLLGLSALLGRNIPRGF